MSRFLSESADMFDTQFPWQPATVAHLTYISYVHKPANHLLSSLRTLARRESHWLSYQKPIRASSTNKQGAVVSEKSLFLKTLPRWQCQSRLQALLRQTALIPPVIVNVRPSITWASSNSEHTVLTPLIHDQLPN